MPSGPGERRVCEVIKKELTFKSVCARYLQVTNNLEYNQHFMNCRHRDANITTCRHVVMISEEFCLFPRLRRTFWYDE